jgi:hypothetical protein
MFMIRYLFFATNTILSNTKIQNLYYFAIRQKYYSVQNEQQKLDEIKDSRERYRHFANMER